MSRGLSQNNTIIIHTVGCQLGLGRILKFTFEYSLIKCSNIRRFGVIIIILGGKGQTAKLIYLSSYRLSCIYAHPSYVLSF